MMRDNFDYFYLNDGDRNQVNGMQIAETIKQKNVGQPK